MGKMKDIAITSMYNNELATFLAEYLYQHDGFLEIEGDNYNYTINEEKLKERIKVFLDKRSEA